MRKLLLASSLLLLTVGALIPARSYAEMWCAEPLVVHEWGVHVFASPGARRSGSPTLPSYYHDRGPRRPNTAAPVRQLPVDSGMRELPIVHFYSTSMFTPVPVGIEVGFTRGDAARWYPQVDRRTPASESNGARALAARRRLLAAHGAPGRALTARRLASDPTRQLEWASLLLTVTPLHARHASERTWVDRLRGLEGALWVNTASESERFVFYDARSSEQPAIALARGPSFDAQRHHYLLRNTGTHAVHDVFFVQREGTTASIFYAPSIPAGAHAGFVAEEHRVAPNDVMAATRGQLRTALVDSRESVPPSGSHWDRDGCVMGRDPAVPLDTAQGHRVYAAEVDAILAVWGSRFFDQPGTTLVYREDPAYLDAVMPISVYTDMYHFVQLRRAGLAIQSDVSLP